jgi:hypothetical protein
MRAAAVAWAEASKGFKGVPSRVTSNPRTATAEQAIFFVRDALDGGDPCHPQIPGPGNGTLRRFDAHTVMGVCSASEGIVVCSSDAIRAILAVERKVEPSKDISPSMTFIFAHEFGHVLLRHPGAFVEGVTVISFSKSREENIQQFVQSCEDDPEQMKRESEADQFAFRVLNTVLAAPTYRSPDISPEESIRSNAETIYWAGKGLSEWAARYYGAADTEPLPNAAKLCKLVNRTRGTVVFPVYGGSHPQPLNRLASIVNFEGEFINKARVARGESLNDGSAPLLDLNRLTDNLLAAAFEQGAKQFCRRVSALENGTLDCANQTDNADGTESLDLDLSSHEASVNLPISFNLVGPYRETDGSNASAFIVSIGSYNTAPTKSLALVEAKRMAETYASFYSQLEAFLHQRGGYWIYEWHSEVETSFNQFVQEYMSSMTMRAVLRVPSSFNPAQIPAVKDLRRWGRVDDLNVVPWQQARFPVIIHFFRPGTQGANKDSQRVITHSLLWDQIFDLAASQRGERNSPAQFFADLLPFLRTKLKASFGLDYTLSEEGTGDDTFYVSLGSLGENFYLPKTWEAGIYSITPRKTLDSELSKAVDKIWVDNSTQEDISTILK